MRRVLIVEDDAILSGIIAQRLKREMIDSYLATSGEEALSIINSVTPDLMLLDLMLAGDITGLDVLDKLDFNSKGIKFPVIILSNLDSEKDIARKKGAIDYMVKANISLDDLVSKIKDNLSG